METDSRSTQSLLAAFLFVDDTTDPRNPVAWLMCTLCRKKVKRIGEDETVNINRPHFCPPCDPGIDVVQDENPEGPLVFMRKASGTPPEEW